MILLPLGMLFYGLGFKAISTRFGNRIPLLNALLSFLVAAISTVIELILLQVNFYIGTDMFPFSLYRWIISRYPWFFWLLEFLALLIVSLLCLSTGIMLVRMKQIAGETGLTIFLSILFLASGIGYMVPLVNAHVWPVGVYTILIWLSTFTNLMMAGKLYVVSNFDYEFESEESVAEMLHPSQEDNND